VSKRWTNASKKKPNTDEDVLVVTLQGDYGIGFWDNEWPEITPGQWWVHGEHSLSKMKVTHWMPLPKLPKRKL